jgi:hypothetical protein
MFGAVDGKASNRCRHRSHHCEASSLAALQAGQITHVASAHGFSL